jgi:dTDP-4-dehydrorhamnose 3,5-epimerase
MEVKVTAIPEVKIITLEIHRDERGHFTETWNKKRYEEAGIFEIFVQDNLSYSKKNVLRGLHFQNPNGQGKLVSVLDGEVFDVAVDIRVGSPTFGQWIAEYLSSSNGKQLYIPPGFAHGFYVTSEYAYFSYKCTKLYSSASEHCITWNDPEINIHWPTSSPLVSEKDQNGEILTKINTNKLPSFISPNE